ncbi:hypothetical protein SAMN04488498_102528 [Mesorhizobium albiziae]|uniref:Uncharacterized protein n=1 Tax=Neomesorhizobium albiziae TaxID=335020 RepID=A0A1I3WYN0_9HYPH|nr:hypothetical protein SAMN04488498_102528 [Mesorhizobium albiziae]
MAPHTPVPAESPARSGPSLQSRRLLTPPLTKIKPACQPFSANLRADRRGGSLTQPRRRKSDFVFVVADANDVGNVVVFLFLVGEEGIVVIVVAEIDIFVVL